MLHLQSPIETRPKVIGERICQEGLPGRNDITRETSREDALATTRHFFSAVTERSATDVPVTTTVSVSQTDTPPVTSVAVETERPGTRNFSCKNFSS